MDAWDGADAENEWTGDQWEYMRLTSVTFRVMGPADTQVTLCFLEDETHTVTRLPDASALSAANRLGAGGWEVRPMSSEAGEVPFFLMQGARSYRGDLRQDGARWDRYWLTRRRMLDELYDETEAVADDETDQ